MRLVLSSEDDVSAMASIMKDRPYILSRFALKFRVKSTNELHSGLKYFLMRIWLSS